MTEKPTVITCDAALKRIEGSVVTETDEAVLNPDPSSTVTITSAEQLMALAMAAQETYRHFSEEIAPRMTDERAVEIRRLRVDEGYSWRAVAAATHEAWGSDATWTPFSNQLAGMALCKIAAERLGENAGEAPWN
jgi:hypothetical protein